MGEVGLAALRSTCSQAGQLFRELSQDVGVDGIIEACDGEVPTGEFFGVQVKSGPSFLSETGKHVLLPADASHLAYWARCSFPIVGIIHIPSQSRTFWFNVSSECSRERILRGPYTLRARASRAQELTPDSLRCKLIPEILAFKHNRLSVSESRALLRERARIGRPSTEKLQRVHEWRHLIDIASGISSSDADVAEAAYALSWYFPTANKAQKRMLERALSHPSDLQLTKLLRAIRFLLNQDHDSAGDCVADLVGYVPNHKDRIVALLEGRLLPPDAVEAAIQVIEYTDGNLRADLRLRFAGYPG
jgi:hypothetical protein